MSVIQLLTIQEQAVAITVTVRNLILSVHKNKEAVKI
jgi:hypothetical protein